MKRNEVKLNAQLEEMLSIIAICPVSVIKLVPGGVYFHASNWGLDIRQKGVLSTRKVFRLIKKYKRNVNRFKVHNNEHMIKSSLFKGVKMPKWEFIPDVI